MKTTINSRLLAQGLSFVSRIITRQSIGAIQLVDGSVVATSAKGKAWFKVGEFEGSTCIKQAPLESALAAGGEEIILDASESSALIKSGSLKIKAPTLDAAELVQWGQVNHNPIALPHLVLDVVGFGSLMAHPDENSDFDHIHIQSHQDKLVAFGTDRSNFSVQLTELPWIGQEDLFIPTSALPLLKAMEGDVVVVDSDGDKLQVSSADCGFTIPLFHDRRSMSYAKVIAIKQPLAGIANREELLGLLRAYMGIHAPSGKGMSLSCDVELKVQGGALHLLGEGESFDGAATLRDSVDGVTIMANAIPLIAALNVFDCDEVAVGFSDPKSPISIEAAVPDGRLAMMAPMRRQ